MPELRGAGSKSGKDGTKSGTKPGFGLGSLAKSGLVRRASRKASQLLGVDERAVNKLKALKCSADEACRGKAHCTATVDPQTWGEAVGAVTPAVSKCKMDDAKLEALVGDIHGRWKARKWGYPEGYIEEESVDGFLVELLDRDSRRRLKLGLYPPKAYHDVLVWRATGVLKDHFAVALVYFLAITTWRSKVVMDARVIDTSVAWILDGVRHRDVALKAEIMARSLSGVVFELKKDPMVARVTRSAKRSTGKAAGGLGFVKLFLGGLTVLTMAGAAVASDPPPLQSDEVGEAIGSDVGAGAGAARVPWGGDVPWGKTYGEVAAQTAGIAGEAVAYAAEHVVENVRFSVTYIGKSVVVTVTDPIQVYMNTFYGNAEARLSTRLRVFQKGARRVAEALEDTGASSKQGRQEVVRAQLDSKLHDLMGGVNASIKIMGPERAMEAVVLEALETIPMAAYPDDGDTLRQFTMDRVLDSTFGGGHLWSPDWRTVTGLNGASARSMLKDSIKRVAKERRVTITTDINRVVDRVADRPEETEMTGTELGDMAQALYDLTRANTPEMEEFRERAIWDIAYARIERNGRQPPELTQAERNVYFRQVREELNQAMRDRGNAAPGDDSRVARAGTVQRLTAQLKSEWEQAKVRQAALDKAVRDEAERVRRAEAAQALADAEAAKRAEEARAAHEAQQVAQAEAEAAAARAAESARFFEGLQEKHRNEVAKAERLMREKKAEEARKAQEKADKLLREKRAAEQAKKVANKKSVDTERTARQAKDTYSRVQRSSDQADTNATRTTEELNAARFNFNSAQEDAQAAGEDVNATEAAYRRTMEEEARPENPERDTFTSEPNPERAPDRRPPSWAAYVGDMMEERPTTFAGAVAALAAGVVMTVWAAIWANRSYVRRRFDAVSIGYAPPGTARYYVVLPPHPLEFRLVYTYSHETIFGSQVYYPAEKAGVAYIRRKLGSTFNNLPLNKMKYLGRADQGANLELGMKEILERFDETLLQQLET